MKEPAGCTVATRGARVKREVTEIDMLLDVTQQVEGHACALSMLLPAGAGLIKNFRPIEVRVFTSAQLLPATGRVAALPQVIA